MFSARSVTLRNCEKKSIFSDFSTVTANSAVHQNLPQLHFRTVCRDLTHYRTMHVCNRTSKGFRLSHRRIEFTQRFKNKEEMSTRSKKTRRSSSHRNIVIIINKSCNIRCGWLPIWYVVTKRYEGPRVTL